MVRGGCAALAWVVGVQRSGTSVQPEASIPLSFMRFLSWVTESSLRLSSGISSISTISAVRVAPNVLVDALLVPRLRVSTGRGSPARKLADNLGYLLGIPAPKALALAPKALAST